jgi:hypothetical protein
MSTKTLPSLMVLSATAIIQKRIMLSYSLFLYLSNHSMVPSVVTSVRSHYQSAPTSDDTYSPTSVVRHVVIQILVQRKHPRLVHGTQAKEELGYHEGKTSSVVKIGRAGFSGTTSRELKSLGLPPGRIFLSEALPSISKSELPVFIMGQLGCQAE